MKKILFLLLISIASYGQADFPEGVQISGGQPTVTSTSFLTAVDGTGLLTKIEPVNLPFALDANVLHKTGNETKSGILTISNKINLAAITVNSTNGYILKDGQPFIHNFYAGVNPLQGGSGNNLNIGYNSGNFNSNNFNYASTMVGFESGLSNKNGYSNVGIGYRNLHLNENGFGNSALGTYVLGNLTDGTQNTSIGWHSMLYSTTASENTAVGVEALWNNLTGLRNTALGMRAGTSNTGSDNVFIGYNAGSAYTGSNKLYVANTNRTLIEGDFSGNGFVTLNGAGEFMVAPSRKITFKNASGVEASLGWFSNLNTETNAYLDAFDYRIRTGGTVRLQISNAGALTVPTAPTTSAGTYDILTRNTSTGVVEKVLSTTFQAPITNPVTGTGINGQVSFWGSTSIQTGDNALFWDNTNKKLGVGTNNPVGKLDVFTGLSGITTTVASVPDGTISLVNSGSATTVPTIIGRSNNSVGLAFQSGSNDSNSLQPDMLFGVRENDNTDFTTLTSSAFRFSRFNTTLVDVLRNGNFGIGTSTPTYNLTVNSNAVSSFMQFTSTTSGTTSLDGLIIGTGSTGEAVFINRENTGIGFYTNNFERLRISGTGETGVLTTTPLNNLSVSVAAANKGISLQNVAGSAEYARFGVLNVGVSNDSYIGSISNNNFSIYTNNTEKLKVFTTGGVSIGNSTDTGAGTLNVAGNISTIAATTANQVPIKSQLDAIARPYKSYVASLTQVGAAAPTVSVLENTLGGSVVWSRTATGNYAATLVGAYPLNKTAVFMGTPVTSTIRYSAVRSSNDVVYVTTYNGTPPVQTDGGLLETAFEIRVYP